MKNCCGRDISGPDKSPWINESYNLRFRAETFNTLNHLNFAYPNVVFSGGIYSSSADVITQTSTTSRQIQFALKLMF